MRTRRTTPLLVTGLLLVTTAACVTPDDPRAGAGVLAPPVAAVADYQIGGPYPPAPGVGVVVRDHTAEPAEGVYGVCYVNAFQTQPEDADRWRTEHPDLLLRVGGDLVEDEGWPGEFLLDTSTARQRTALAEVVGAWVQQCADAGYSAVEADNLDSDTRSRGALTRADGLAYAALLADRAHALGLAFGQKNAPDLTPAQVREVGFDFVVAESCELYDECDAYTALHGEHVIEVEYVEDGVEVFERACARRGGEVSVLLRDRDVVPRGEPGHVSRSC